MSVGKQQVWYSDLLRTALRSDDGGLDAFVSFTRWQEESMREVGGVRGVVCNAGSFEDSAIV